MPAPYICCKEGVQRKTSTIHPSCFLFLDLLVYLKAISLVVYTLYSSSTWSYTATCSVTIALLQMGLLVVITFRLPDGSFRLMHVSVRLCQDLLCCSPVSSSPLLAPAPSLPLQRLAPRTPVCMHDNFLACIPSTVAKEARCESHDPAYRLPLSSFHPQPFFPL